jgi:exo-beta-1,3-glucanase (GH17 family)
VSRAVAALLAGALALGCAGAAPRPNATAPAARGTPRAFHPFDGDRWIGAGVSYGPHRDGQRPGGASPSRAQLREDLELLRGRFALLRVYGSDAPTPDLLALLREERLPFKVLLGAWIAPETGAVAPGSPRAVKEGARAANRAQVEAAVALANAYPELVLALVIGNETQVDWSDHRVDPAVLVGWLREARRATAVPVATADDFAFWLEPRSDVVAAEADFIVTHAYAMWNGKPLAEALAFTRDRYAAVAARHPGLPVVLGEAGWATRKHSEGDQAKYITGEPGEPQQRSFYQQFSGWVGRERITSIWFEAFDENWKGGDHPDEVEKHWGLWRADRTPKAAVAGAR